MPELPEVETTMNGISPFILQQKIVDIIIRQKKLRWPIPNGLLGQLSGEKVQQIQRRGKYLLIFFSKGTLIIHLGMSGSLRIVKADLPPKAHDHVDLLFSNHRCLRFTDPRRFGAVLWTTTDPMQHVLLAHLGPEPLSLAFNAEYLWEKSRGRKAAIKTFIMDGRIVVGVGNIYACEALFMAGIHPSKAAGKIKWVDFEKLVSAIQTVLAAAIRQGGTSLKDFVQSDGSKGYFKVHLQVYGRGGQGCLTCGTPLKELRLTQRSTVFCPKCQRR
jgi:formamidopyrimidine-DNA glycosylase